MLALPKSVLIEDEAPRDGVRYEKRVFSVEQKLSPIADIAAAGAFGSAPSSIPPARRKWPGRTPCSQPRRRARASSIPPSSSTAPDGTGR